MRDPCTMLNAQSGSVTALVMDTKGTGEAEQAISLATTNLPFPTPWS